MLKHRIIPCLLLKDGKLTKTIRFGLDDAGHPTHERVRNIGNYIAAVKVFNARDVDELVLLDISASDDGRLGPNEFLVQDVARECFMPLAVGGGIGNFFDKKRPEKGTENGLQWAHQLLRFGADKVVVDTHAIRNPKLISALANRFGAQLVVVAIDVRRNRDEKQKVYRRNGRNETDWAPVDWAKEAERLGAGEIFLTSIDNDGLMKGYDVALTRSVAKAVKIPVIASGGAGELQHFADVVKQGKADAVAAASIFQYTQYTPNDIKAYLAEHGVPVRLQR